MELEEEEKKDMLVSIIITNTEQMHKEDTADTPTVKPRPNAAASK